MRLTMEALLALPWLATLAIAGFFGVSHSKTVVLVILSAVLPSGIALFWISRMTRQHRLQNLSFTQRLIDAIPQPVYVKDAASRIVMANTAYFGIYGKLSPDAIIGHNPLEYTENHDYIEQTIEEDKRVLEGSPVIKEENKPDPRTGTERFRLIMKGTCTDIEGMPVIVGANFDITSWRKTERELDAALQREQTNHRLTADFSLRILDMIRYPVFVKDRNGRYTLVNRAFLEENGIPERQLDGSIVFPSHAEEAADTQLEQNEERLVLAGAPVRREAQFRHYYSGRLQSRIVTKHPCFDPDGHPVVVGAHVDLTDLRSAEKELQAVLAREQVMRQHTEDFLQRLLDVIPDALYIKDARGRIRTCNKAFATLVNRSVSELIGQVSSTLPYTPSLPAEIASEDKRILEGESINKEEYMPASIAGAECFRIVSKRRCSDQNGDPVVVAAFFDITQWKVAERNLQRLAQEDALTGLSNRRHFQQEASRAIQQCKRYGGTLSLLLFDLDHFKSVNDCYGHLTGDKVLKAITQRCHEILRAGDLPGRWGGEEFVLLLPNTGEEEALQVAERLRARCAQTPLLIDERPLSVCISCGVAEWNGSGDLDELISRADEALYRAKDGGRNRSERAS